MKAVACALAFALLVPATTADAKRHAKHRKARVWVVRKAPTRLFPSMVFVLPAEAPGPGAPDSDPAPPSPPAPPAPVVLPSRTGVDLDEYFVHSAYGKLAAGPVELNVTNFGMDDHDITVENAAAVQLAQVYLTPGEGTQVNLTLAPGTYRLYCSLYDGAHDQLGMNAQLVVE
ncbi:MAG: hypothetical protein ACJ762_12725 [Solirubrobacteraceae bacterium]